ncbi:MAG: hypothetical protein AAFU60_04050, partial [Bacteroidota bacterium]
MQSFVRTVKRVIWFLFPALLFWYCQSGLQESQVARYRNLASDVKYVGIETCQSCHADIHSTFVHTGMGKSFAPATRAKSDATFGDHALVYDANTNFYYYPYFQDSSL